MTEPISIQSTPAAAKHSRLADVLWGAGLSFAAFGNFAAAIGGAGVGGRSSAVIGIGLAGMAGLTAWFRGRSSVVGAGVALCCSVFTYVVAGRSPETAVLALDAAPQYAEEVDADFTPQHLGVPDGSASEWLFRPGPVALGIDSPLLLAQVNFAPSTLVAALWDGAWYAGRILSVNGDAVRIHFVGWESDLDMTLPRGHLRGLDERKAPRPTGSAPTARLGTDAPLPNAMLLAVFQPGGAVEALDFGTLSPRATLYAMRLDTAGLAVEMAIPGLDAALPFGVLASTALRIDAGGAYYFDASSDGATQLWIDDVAVASGTATNLTPGVHSLKLEYRHSQGPTMSLGLRIGTEAGQWHTLDMNRYGVAQAAREADGSLRLVLAEGILFDVDQDQLNASAERALESVYRLSVVPSGDARVQIEGHTDDRGSDDYNLALSERRAERVRSWLVAHGRAEATLLTKGFGEGRPRLPNTSDSNRKANRRVELLIGGSADAVAASTGAATPGPVNAASAALSPKARAAEELIKTYFRALNDGPFDANRYFEPNVERFVTMMNTTSRAINHYIIDVFPKQFHDHHFAMEEGTLVEEAPNQYVFIEQARYTMAKKTTPTSKRVRVRVRTSPAGKLVFFHQFEVLK